jgi:acyl-CoA thioesterase-1
MLSRFALVIIFTVFSNSLFISSAAARADTAPTILVFGDSLSAAYGIAREQGWVTLLQQRLKNKDLPYQVANASISGETTSGGLSRMQSALNQYKPDIVLLELGANDGLRGLPVADMQRNLAAMIKASQAAKAKVVLIGIMIPPNYGPRYTREFAESYHMLAQRYHLPLVDFLLDGVAGNRELTQDDGLHPNASAQPRLLDNVWEVLQPELIGKKKTAYK